MVLNSSHASVTMTYSLRQVSHGNGHNHRTLPKILIALRRKKEIEAVLIQHWDRIACGDMIVYFVDECHVLGDTAVGYGWAPSNQRVTVIVQNNHDRQTYFGALQMLTGELVLADYPTANGDTTVAFMHRLRNKHPGKQLLILWDNVSYHYQGDMKEFLVDVNAFLEPDAWIVTCMRFAPYASEQNPIEHVWQIGKQYVRALFHSMHTFSDIKGALQDFPDNESRSTASGRLEEFFPFFDQIAHEALSAHGFLTR